MHDGKEKRVRRKANLVAKKRKKFGKRVFKLRLPRRAGAPQQQNPEPPPQPPPPPSAEPDLLVAGAGPSRSNKTPLPPVDPPPDTAGWRRLNLDVGWCLWNQAQGRPDAHCNMHPGCRMNRAFRRGCIRLTMAWLKSTKEAASKDEHDYFKEALPAEEDFDKRQSTRREVVALSEVEGPQRDLIGQVMEQEVDLRGGDRSEPRWFSCKAGVWTRALRYYQLSEG